MEALPGMPSDISLYAADTYVVGGIFFSRANSHPWRTLNPALADLFFVPAFTNREGASMNICADALERNSSSMRKRCSKDRLFERMEAAAPGSLYARNGSDHVLLVSRHGYHYDVSVSYELKITDRRFGLATRFSMEEGRAQYEWPGARTMKFFRSTPFASFIHAHPSTPWSSLPWRTTAAHRTTLVAVAFNAVHKAGPAVHQLNTLREALLASCNGAGDQSVCSTLRLSPTHVQVKGYHMRVLGRIAALYWRSTFCLQPVGDACTRKATIDAILLGCIPVLFHRCQTLQWPWHWGSWVHDATVLIDMNKHNITRNTGSLDVVQYLRTIPASEIARMQHVIAMHAHCLHYRTPATPWEGRRPTNETGRGGSTRATIGEANDAFDIALQGSLLLSMRQQKAMPASEVASRLSSLCTRVRRPGRAMHDSI
jgi:hypothetical protein